MSEREIKVAGEQLLIRSLKRPLSIAEAIQTKDYISLAGAAIIASEAISPALAMTDPPRYKALMTAVTRYHVKGYTILSISKLKEKACIALEKRKT